MDIQKLFQEEYEEAYSEFYDELNREHEFDFDEYNSFEYGRIRGIEMLANKLKIDLKEVKEEDFEDEEEEY